MGSVESRGAPASVTQRADRGVITSALSPEQTSDVLRAHLPPPTAFGLTTLLGVRPAGDTVTGVAIGRRVSVRPLPAGIRRRDLPWTLKLRGSIEGRTSGGCDVHWKIVAPVLAKTFTRVVCSLGLAAVLVVSLLPAKDVIGSPSGTRSTLLIGAAVFAGVLLLSELRWRSLRRGSEPTQRTLLADWLHEVTSDLTPDTASAAEANRDTEGH